MDKPLTVYKYKVGIFDFGSDDFDEWLTQNCPLWYDGRAYTMVAPVSAVDLVADMHVKSLGAVQNSSMLFLKVIYEYAGYFESGGEVSKLSSYLHRNRKRTVPELYAMISSNPVAEDILHRWCLRSWVEKEE